MDLYNRNYANVAQDESQSELSYSKASFVKKTYQYLAASLLAATAGAYIGMQMAVAPSFWFLLIEIALLIGLIASKRNTALASVLLFAFTFVTGFTLAPMLNFYISNGMGSIVTNAFLMTTVAFGALSVFAFNTKRDFSALGKILFIALIVVVVASIINIFTQSPIFQLVIASIGAVLFSAYILYDTQNIIRGNYDSAILGAVALYLDILNLFVSLIQILSAFSGSRD